MESMAVVSSFCYTGTRKEGNEMRKSNKVQRRMLLVVTLAACLSLLMAGCGSSEEFTGLALAQTDMGDITVPEDVLVVGLGEASHGVKEYQEMKAEVFKALVQNNGCRTFIIEGDFGSALKVDNYIHGGEGTAKEAAACIGFRIYRTREMEELIEWMRDYNETAVEGEDLHFYGMDMQWADNSKEYVFRILEQVVPEACEGHREALAFLKDEDMYDISTDAFVQGMPAAESLLQEVDGAKDSIVEAFGSEAFELARECANSIYNCCDIRRSDLEYNEVRDGHMAEKVQWFLDHGDGSVIFINGHNGHIGKVSVAAYDCLGSLLAEKLGGGYFAIGTDAEVTTFNNQTDDGFEELTVTNGNSLNALAGECGEGRYYIDFAAAAGDDGWDRILEEKQSLTTLNVSAVTIVKSFYTTEIVLRDTFDGMIVFDKVSPTTLDL